MHFVNVDQVFYKFPPGFDPHSRDPTWSQKGKWNYHQMCAFWFKRVFELQIIQRYRYMMRLDDDSQLTGERISKDSPLSEAESLPGPWPNVFELMAQNQAVYMANGREVDFEYVLPGTKLIREVIINFIDRTKIIPRNPPMLADIFNRTLEIPNYWNNFEVVELAFIRRKDVLDFIDAVDRTHGIFLYRWGDAPLRYALLALFANATQILHRVKLQLGYCHPC